MSAIKNNLDHQKIAFLGLSKSDKKIYLSCKKEGKYYQEKNISVKKDNDEQLIPLLRDYAKKNRVKIYAAGFSGFANFQNIATKFWQTLDIVPQEIKNNKQQSEKSARLACKKASCLFNDDLTPNVFINKQGVVQERFLTNLSTYKKIAKQEDWEKIINISRACQKNNLKVAFINSTAAGGGVALMRHALIRFFLLLGVSVKWLVLEGDNDIFNITKKKVHNVLHGIATHDVMLTKQDKAQYNQWIKENFKNMEEVIKKIDVILIDDPQPSGLIPLIKKRWPEKKIIYRSHIQIYSKLINKGVEQNKNTWDFVWNNAKLADIFISHPIKKFTPKDVPEDKIIYQPATTDRLDGLNKHISSDDKKYYYTLFNNLLVESGLEPLNLKRSYIIQVARFDPSKGIPDVIESYRKLRKSLFKKGIDDKNMPQLVIAGNGANDDPESMPIYQEIRQTIQMDTFKKFRNDIKVARLPHNDQLLNILLSGAKVALQLSHREGFEVKVTEALIKGVPVIAYKTGGIPLQIEDGKTGFLVPRGETKEVARILEKLFTNKSFYKDISKNAKTNVNDDYFTINSAYRWLFLSLLLHTQNNIKITSRDFKNLEKKYLTSILTD